jgi:hypothetical protein
MILHIQQGLKEDGFTVPMTKLCRWFDVPRRTVYYKPVKSTPKVQERFAEPIKQMIEAEPSFGYRTVASLLQFNKNTVQRIFQLKGWQVRNEPSDIDRVSRRSRRSPRRRTNAGRRICAASGQVETAGRPWRSSSTVTRENCWAGSSREAAERRRQRRRSSKR